MPNMFGGDQHHPAYDPRVPVRRDQKMVGNDLYTVSEDGTVVREGVDGSKEFVTEYPEDVAALRFQIMESS